MLPHGCGRPMSCSLEALHLLQWRPWMVAPLSAPHLLQVAQSPHLLLPCSCAFVPTLGVDGLRKMAKTTRLVRVNGVT